MARKKLRVNDYVRVIEALRRHETERSIARTGVASRNTIAAIRTQAEKLGWLEPEADCPTAEQVAALFVKEAVVPVQVSKVSAHHDQVQKWVDLGLKSKQIFRKLVDLQRTDPDSLKFQGSVGSVKRYIRQLTAQQPKVHMVLQFDPGEAAQVDFGSGPKLYEPETGQVRPTHIFVMTLCYSRHTYAEIVWDQKVDTWLRCHQNAFQFFGGVPKRIILDNLKAAITRACRRDPVVQRSFENFAKAWGFKIDPNPPASPWLKGRVESGVKYIKGAVFCRDFTSIIDAQTALDEFVLGEAGNRIHGTTKQRPLSVFVEEDQPELLSIPDPVPDIVHWALLTVHVTIHVYHRKGYYSVPYRYVGKHVMLRAGLKIVEIEDPETGVVIASHPVTTRPGQFRTNLEHYPPEKRNPMELTGEVCIKRAHAIGPQTGEFVTTLLADKVLERLGAVRGVLALAKDYGPKRLESACARALQHGLQTYSGIKRILQKGLDQAPVVNSGQLTFPEFGPTRYARSIADMLSEAV